MLLLSSQRGLEGIRSSVLNVIYKLLSFLAGQLDVVLFAEIVHGIGDLRTSVSSLCWGKQQPQSSAGDATAEECANVT